MLNEGDVVQRFADAMRERGIETEDDIIPDGRLHRCHVNGDRRGSKNGWYKVHADGVPNGQFGCNKRHGSEKFHWKAAEGTSQMSPAEREEMRCHAKRRREQQETEARRRRDDAAAYAAKIWDASEEVSPDHPYLKRKGVKSHGLRVGAWSVVNPDTGEMTVVSKLALLVPMRITKTEMLSLQAIFPSKSNVLKRDKDFLRDGTKQGCFFAIGTRPIDNVIVVCEGYATGATIHECTGHVVAVAFDAGNLIHVARTFRDRMSGAKILIAADNDQWTTKPVANPGVTRATEAAASIDGIVAIPQFSDVTKSPTDFNDLALLEGPDAVRKIIADALNPSPPPAEPLVAINEAAVPTEPPPATPANALHEYEQLGRFTVLGYDHGNYFIFHHGKQQILRYNKSDFTDNGLIELSDINFWEQTFPSQKGIDRKAAFNFFVNMAHRRGIYDIDRIRGRGVWTDAGRMVFHHGDRLTVDGVDMPITAIASKYVYELAKALPDPSDTMLTDEEGERIMEIAEKFRWTKPASAALLVGWIMLAPICGALKWRPHVWITGGPGCGKSSILTRFVYGLIGRSGLYSQGASTEPGIRQNLKADAIPVMLDEAEQNEEGDKRRMQNIISMIRQASSESEARTFKGTPGGNPLSFHIRSMFCLASIQVGMKNQADIERLTVLLLRGKSDGRDNEKVWKEIDADLYSIERDTDITRRLLRRTIELLPVIQQNIEVFVQAAAQKFGNQRDGDQYGTLLAGACAIWSQQPVTLERARALIDGFDWSEHRDRSEDDDSMLALGALTEAHIRAHGGAEVTVFELLTAAAGVVRPGGVGKDPAESTLLRYGMRVVRESPELLWLVISNSSHELRKLVEGTGYDADLRGMLLRVPGADRNNNVGMRFNGTLSKCIRVPIQAMVADSYKNWGDT